MNNEKMKFWITCPSCKRKFGTEPKIVMKYVDRFFNQATERMVENMKKFTERQGHQK